MNWRCHGSNAARPVSLSHQDANSGNIGKCPRVRRHVEVAHPANRARLMERRIAPCVVVRVVNYSRSQRARGMPSEREATAEVPERRLHAHVAERSAGQAYGRFCQVAGAGACGGSRRVSPAAAVGRCGRVGACATTSTRFATACHQQRGTARLRPWKLFGMPPNGRQRQ